MKKTVKDFIRIMTDGVNYSAMTTRQKLNCIGFGLSFAAMVVAGFSFLTIPAIVALAYFSVQIKGLDIEE